MPVSASFDEPTIPPRLQRPLAAIWISLGLHAALIALVQVAPPMASGPQGPVIEARLMPVKTPSVVRETRATPPEPARVVAASESAVSVVHSPPPDNAPAAAQPAAASDTVAAPSPTPPMAVTSSVDLTYYDWRALDVQPRALTPITAAYPETAERQQLSGSVRLQLKVEADGRVVDVEILRSTPPGVFDQTAIAAYRGARFAPALRQGQPVRALMVIEHRFDWDGDLR
jgi:protein TonB